MKIYILLLPILLLNANKDVKVIERSISPYGYAYRTAIQYSHISTKTAERYADVITNASAVYSLDPYIVTDMIEVESHFKYWAVSKANCHGPLQVSAAHLYILSNLFPEIKKPKPRHFRRIGYGVHSGAYHLAELIDKYGNYADALIAYGYKDGHKKIMKLREEGKSPFEYEYVRKVLR